MHRTALLPPQLTSLTEETILFNAKEQPAFAQISHAPRQSCTLAPPTRPQEQKHSGADRTGRRQPRA